MTDFDEFSSLARTWATLYQTKETTYLAVRQDESWLLLYSRVVFFPARAIEQPNVEVNTVSVRAGQFRTEINKANALNVMNEVLSAPGRVSWKEWSVDFLQAFSRRERFERLYPPRMPGQMRLPTYTIELGPIDLRNRKDSLALELLACERPYEDLEELCAELRIPVAPGDPARATFGEIILGTPFSIDASSSLAGGKLNLNIVAPSQIGSEELTVSVKAFFAPDVAPRRVLVPLEDFKWRIADGVHFFECASNMPDVQLALAIVSYKGEFCHKWWLRDQSKSFSPRYQIHRLLDKGGLFEKTVLDGKNEFEAGISLLLSLINLTVLSYGNLASLREGPDILAYSSSGDLHDLYVIECTTGDIDSKGKIQKLANRTREIAALAQNSPTLIRNVIPVVFTSLLRDEIAPHLPKLEALKIPVFCREDIQRILSRIEAPPSAEQIRETVQSLIPNVTPSDNPKLI